MEQVATPSVTGTLLVSEHVISPELANERPVLIHLPWDYHETDKHYPVLYMHDGQNLFDRATSIGDEWEVDETLEALNARGLQAIVVGIPNMGAERLDEYSPFVDERHGGGKGDAYLDFIVGTIKPQVDAAFRTLPEREYTGIMGSSMGGLISLYGFFRHSEVFGFVGAMSPSLWFADRAIFPLVEAAPHVPGLIYLDVGTEEGSETLIDAEQLYELLSAKGYKVGRELLYLEEPGADHSEAAWAGRLYTAMRLFMRGATTRTT